MALGGLSGAGAARTVSSGGAVSSENGPLGTQSIRPRAPAPAGRAPGHGQGPTLTAPGPAAKGNFQIFADDRRPAPSSSSVSGAAPAFAVFSDEPSAQLAENAQWTSLGSQRQARKENEGRVQRWTDGPLLAPAPGVTPAPVVHAHAVPAIAVFCDPEMAEEAPSHDHGRIVPAPSSSQGGREGQGRSRLELEDARPLIGRGLAPARGREASDPLERHKQPTAPAPASAPYPNPNPNPAPTSASGAPAAAAAVAPIARVAPNLNPNPIARVAPSPAPTPDPASAPAPGPIHAFQIFSDSPIPNPTPSLIFSYSPPAPAPAPSTVPAGPKAHPLNLLQQCIHRNPNPNPNLLQQCIRGEAPNPNPNPSIRGEALAMGLTQQPPAAPARGCEAGGGDAELDSLMAEMGLLDSEDGTINTRLARQHIDALFCSPSAPPSPRSGSGPLCSAGRGMSSGGLSASASTRSLGPRGARHDQGLFAHFDTTADLSAIKEVRHTRKAHLYAHAHTHTLTITTKDVRASPTLTLTLTATKDVRACPTCS